MSSGQDIPMSAVEDMGGVILRPDTHVRILDMVNIILRWRWA